MSAGGAAAEEGVRAASGRQDAMDPASPVRTVGIDGALHVVERLHGPEQARWTGQQGMEYRG